MVEAVARHHRSLRAIAAAPTPWRRKGRRPTLSRSPIAGISWRTPARPFSTPSASRCAQFGRLSARRRSIPALLTAAERLQYEGYLRREETNASILAMASEGAAIKEIRRRTGYSRKLIRAVLRGQRSDIFRARQSSLEPWLPWLDEQWAAGRRNGAELWRDLKRQGFRGCLRVVERMGWSATTGRQGSNPRSVTRRRLERSRAC